MDLFSEDALIEQPAIRLFKDGLGWQAVNAYDETYGENGSLGREHRGELRERAARQGAARALAARARAGKSASLDGPLSAPALAPRLRPFH